MKKRKIAMPLIIIAVMVIVPLLSVNAISAITGKDIYRNLLTLIKDEISPNIKDEAKDLSTYAIVNDIIIPKNKILLRKALVETINKNFQSLNDEYKNNLTLSSYFADEEEIFNDLARKVLFIEHAKSMNIIVDEGEVTDYLDELKKERKKRLQDNDADALMTEQLDKEFLQFINLTQEEYEQYYLHDEILYMLYCNKYLLSPEYSDRDSISSISDALLSSAIIKYSE